VIKIDERLARAKHRSAAKAAKGQAIRDIFDRLAHEEEVHVGVLEKFERDLRAVLADDKRR